MEKAASSRGTLTVVTGPMFSGKTGKLVAMSEVFSRMGYTVIVLKPSLDNRYSDLNEIHSHDHRTAEAILVNGETVTQIVKTILAKKASKVIIDEAQFFKPTKITKIIHQLLERNIDVVASGLLYDYKRAPFGVMPSLVGLADEHLKLYAICQKCGRKAAHSERLRGSANEIEVGAADKYIAACERCHVIYQESA